MKTLLVIFIFILLLLAELRSQNNPFNIKLECYEQAIMAEYDNGLKSVISGLSIESLGNYIIKWPEELKGRTYHGTAIVSVNLNENADIISKGFFHPLQNELDSVAFDIIENCQSEFRRLKRDSCTISTTKGGTYLINVEFDKYE